MLSRGVSSCSSSQIRIRTAGCYSPPYSLFSINVGALILQICLLTRLPVFWAHSHYPTADWSVYNAYANPPFGLILPVLQHILRYNHCRNLASSSLVGAPSKNVNRLVRIASAHVDLPSQRFSITFTRYHM